MEYSIDLAQLPREKLNEIYRREDRKVIHTVDNCSAHVAGTDHLDNIVNLFFPPNMTSVLQPVDAAVGRSFKAKFRRFLLDHVLDYVKVLNGRAFKVNEAVTIYHGVRLMAKVWDLVPRSVVLNASFKTRILLSYQNYDIKAKADAKVHRSRRPLKVTVFESKRIASE